MCHHDTVQSTRRNGNELFNMEIVTWLWCCYLGKVIIYQRYSGVAMLNCIHLLGVFDQAGQKGRGTRIILNVISVNHDLFDKFTDLILNKTEVYYQPKQCTIEGKSLNTIYLGNSLWILTIHYESLTWIFRPFWGPDSLTNITTNYGVTNRSRRVAELVREGLVGFGDRLKLLLGTGLLIHILSGNFGGFLGTTKRRRDGVENMEGGKSLAKRCSKFLGVHVYVYVYIYIYIYNIYICIYIYM